MTDQEARNRADEIVRLVLTHGAAAASTVAAKLQMAHGEGVLVGIDRAAAAIRSPLVRGLPGPAGATA